MAHTNTITDLDVDDTHPNILFSASLDYSVKVWNLNNDGKPQSFPQNLSGLYSPFSNDSYIPISSGSATPFQYSI